MLRSEHTADGFELAEFWPDSGTDRRRSGDAWHARADAIAQAIAIDLFALREGVIAAASVRPHAVTHWTAHLWHSPAYPFLAMRGCRFPAMTFAQ